MLESGVDGHFSVVFKYLVSFPTENSAVCLGRGLTETAAID